MKERQGTYSYSASALLFAISIISNGCSPLSAISSNDSQLSGVSQEQSIGLPVIFPTPVDTSANPADTNVLGDSNHWFGHLSLTSKATMQEVYLFYSSEMSKSGWEQISSSISDTIIQIFINRREGRACIITTSARTALKGSHIDITISPLDKTFILTK